MVVLYGNDAFSILVLSTKKQYSSFLKNVLFSRKLSFKVKVLKSLRIFIDCHIKTCRSQKRRPIVKIPTTIFQKNLCSFRWLENETSIRKSVFQCQDKSQPNFCSKTCWKEQSFIFSWWMKFFKHLYSYVIIELTELNWLCKLMKKVKSSQAAIPARKCIIASP